MCLLLLTVAPTVSATALGHFQGPRKFIGVYSLCVNLCGRDSIHQCSNIIKIKLLKSLKHATSGKMADSRGGTMSER